MGNNKRVGNRGSGKKKKAKPSRLDAVRLLPDVVRRLLGIGDPDALLHEVVALIKETLGADEASLLLLEPGTGELVEHEVVAHGQLRPTRYRLPMTERALSTWVAEHRKPLAVPDVRKDKRYLEIRLETRSEATVPITAGDSLLGVLNLESKKLGYFQKGDLRLLEILASQLAVALRLVDWANQAQEFRDRMGALHNLTRLVGGVAPLPTLLQRVVDAVRMTCGGHYAAIFQGDYERQELVLLAQSTAHPVSVAPHTRLKFGTGLLGKAFELGETVNVKDVRKDPMYLFKIPGVMSEICVPIRIGDSCLGILDAQAASVGEFTDDEAKFLESVARVVAPSLQTAGLPVRH